MIPQELSSEVLSRSARYDSDALDSMLSRPLSTGSLPYLNMEVADLEVRLLLEGLYARYGYDFRDYAYSSLRRRVIEAMIGEGLESVSQLQHHVLRNKEVWERVFLKLSVNVTSFFREPSFFRTLRNDVLAALRKEPFIRIWHAGCATGEEVYSTAILLHEEGLLDRTRIYATDMNESVLRTARAGIFKLQDLEEAEGRYAETGGSHRLSRYYSKKYDHARFSRMLSEHVLFSQHNLATHNRFNEFHLVLARNVLIYFNEELQDRANTLFYDSLLPGGFLGVGERENLRYTPYESEFTAIATASGTNSGLYQKAE